MDAKMIDPATDAQKIDADSDAVVAADGPVVVRRYCEGPVPRIPSYWYKFAHPRTLAPPVCMYEKCSWDVADTKQWTEALNFLYSHHGLRPWKDMTLDVLHSLHMIVVQHTKRNGGCLVDDGGWRTEYGLLFKEPEAKTLLEDPKRWGKYWTADDFTVWTKIADRARQYRVRFPSCTRPFDNMIDEKDLTRKEWAVLRKIAYVPPAPRNLPTLLKRFWTDMLAKLASLPQSHSSSPQATQRQPPMGTQAPAASAAPVPPASIPPSSSPAILSTILSNAVSGPSSGGHSEDHAVLNVITWIHQEITRLRPWRFGCGRVARAWCGFILLRLGYLPPPCSPATEYVAAVRHSEVDSGPLRTFFATQMQLAAELMDMGDDTEQELVTNVLAKLFGLSSVEEGPASDPTTTTKQKKRKKRRPRTRQPVPTQTPSSSHTLSCPPLLPVTTPATASEDAMCTH